MKIEFRIQNKKMKEGRAKKLETPGRRQIMTSGT
jgi:hypothetical protein